MHGELSDRTLELSGEINNLQAKLVAKNEKIDALEDTLDVRDKYIALLHEVKREIINRLFRALDDVSRDEDTSNEAQSVSKEEIEAEKERLMEEQEHNRKLCEALTKEQQYNRELQSTVQEMARENKQLKADFEKREDRLHRKIGNLEGEIDIYELVLRAMDKEVKDLQKQVERLENAETIAQKLDPDTRDKVRSLHQNTS